MPIISVIRSVKASDIPISGTKTRFSLPYLTLWQTGDVDGSYLNLLLLNLLLILLVSLGMNLVITVVKLKNSIATLFD